MSQATVQMNLKLKPELANEIDLISRILHISKTEWIKTLLAHEVKKEIEEHKGFLATEYARGNISYEELVQYVGKEGAELVKLGIENTERAFEEAKKVSQRLKGENTSKK